MADRIRLSKRQQDAAASMLSQVLALRAGDQLDVMAAVVFTWCDERDHPQATDARCE